MVAETMREKIHIIMEETGCDPQEAQTALEQTQYDVARAVRAMGSSLRHIVVLKGKCRLEESSLYGLFLIIANVKNKFLLRLRCVFSYNPVIFEMELPGAWFDFERRLSAVRLAEGSSQTLSQEVEHLLTGKLKLENAEGFFEALKTGDNAEVEKTIREFLSGYFHEAHFGISLLREDLNWDQYRQMKGGWEASSLTQTDSFLSPEVLGPSLTLEVCAEEDPQGLRAKELSAGDVIPCQITDHRDVAQYVARLLGGKSGESLIPLPSPVESVAREEETVKVILRFAPGIVGQMILPAQERVKVVRKKESAWWEKLLVWKD